MHLSPFANIVIVACFAASLAGFYHFAHKRTTMSPKLIILITVFFAFAVVDVVVLITQKPKPQTYDHVTSPR